MIEKQQKNTNIKQEKSTNIRDTDIKNTNNKEGRGSQSINNNNNNNNKEEAKTKSEETKTKESHRLSNNIIDKQIGIRLKKRRNLLSISQTELGKLIGVSFQQIQKYEKGGNKLSCSKIFELSKILRVRVSYFFEGLGDDSWEYDEFATNDMSEIDPIKEQIRELEKVIWKVRREKGEEW